MEGLPIVSAYQLEAQLLEVFRRGQARGLRHVVVRDGDLHRAIGSYPGVDHRMSICCGAMRGELQEGDTIISEPPKGEGATLTIRYRLPRTILADPGGARA